MSNEVEDYDEEEVEVAVAPACIASEGYALTVADNTWAGNFGVTWTGGASSYVSEERLREIVRDEVLKALAELGTSTPGTIEL